MCLDETRDDDLQLSEVTFAPYRHKYLEPNDEHRMLARLPANPPVDESVGKKWQLRFSGGERG